jgi:hypothetical protein
MIDDVVVDGDELNDSVIELNDDQLYLKSDVVVLIQLN